MILPYEIIHRSVVPAIRYLITNKLIIEYNLTQKEAANRLGITQSAISNYIRGTRGVSINLENNKNFNNLINNLTTYIVNNSHNSTEVVMKFTELCEEIRKSRFLCKFHKEIEPLYDTGKCHACDKIFKKN